MNFDDFFLIFFIFTKLNLLIKKYSIKDAKIFVRNLIVIIK